MRSCHLQRQFSSFDLYAFYFFFLLNCSGQNYQYCVEQMWQEYIPLPCCRSERKRFQLFTTKYDVSCGFALAAAVQSLSCVQLFMTPWIVACQAPLSMGFSRQEYWSGLPFPSPGDLPHPGIQPTSPALAGKFFTTEPQGSPNGMRGTGNFVFCDLSGNR